MGWKGDHRRPPAYASQTQPSGSQLGWGSQSALSPRAMEWGISLCCYPHSSLHCSPTQLQLAFLCVSSIRFVH